METLNALIALSRLSRRTGKQDTAHQQATSALELSRKTSYKRGVVLALEELGDLARESGDAEEAAKLFEEALVLATEISAEGDLVYELDWRLARVRMQQDRVDEADRLARDAVRLARQSSDRRELGHGLATLGLIRASQGNTDEARGFVEEAIDEFRIIQTPYELAEAHEIASTILSQDPAASQERVAHLFEAHRLFGRLGAAEPCDRVLGAIRALEPRAAGRSGRRTIAESDETDLITDSDTVIDMVATARRIATDEATVIIEGETGTGKELIARIIHEAGPRREHPFVAVNCAALPAHLLESELFGHRRGAFTGADKDRTGILESAGHGTVLLDEIDKASLDFQAKLLRVIEERHLRPVGANRLTDLHARILCASNRGLKELAEKGTFLPDLYYRLASFRLSIPPLRNRPEDIPLLARHFLAPCAERFSAPEYRISLEAEECLLAHSWPGNVRELKNVIEAAAFFARETGVIAPEHLPEDIRTPRPPTDQSLHGRIEELERKEIVAALEKARGIKTEAARILGISRKGLRDRLRRLGLE